MIGQTITCPECNGTGEGKSKSWYSSAYCARCGGQKTIIAGVLCPFLALQSNMSSETNDRICMGLDCVFWDIDNNTCKILLAVKKMAER